MTLQPLRILPRPFRSTPSPGLFVAVPSHAVALASLASAVTAADGLVLLDGEPGTGKTMLALKLMVILAETFTPVLLPTAKFQTAAELHQAILFDLSQPFHGLSEQELRLAVTEQVLKLTAEGQRALIVLDEAHALGDAALAELFHFDNLTHRGERAAAVLLVARPTLKERLKSTALQQRVSATVRVGAFPSEDAESFLNMQLHDTDLSFSDEALDVLLAQGFGNPRRLNRLAATAHTLTVEAGETVLDVEAALAAVEFHYSATTAQPAQATLPEQIPQEVLSIAATARHPATARTPKQKTRKRKVA